MSNPFEKVDKVLVEKHVESLENFIQGQNKVLKSIQEVVTPGMGKKEIEVVLKAIDALLDSNTHIVNILIDARINRQFKLTQQNH